MRREQLIFITLLFPVPDTNVLTRTWQVSKGESRQLVEIRVPTATFALSHIKFMGEGITHTSAATCMKVIRSCQPSGLLRPGSYNPELC